MVAELHEAEVHGEVSLSYMCPVKLVGSMKQASSAVYSTVGGDIFGFIASYYGF